MTSKQLEQRLEKLEAEVAALKVARTEPQTARPWWEEIRGAFRDDPAYREAMKLGREYRESLRAEDDIDSQ
jgi:hypothetical protein